MYLDSPWTFICKWVLLVSQESKSHHEIRDILEPFHFKTPQALLDLLNPERLDRVVSRKESSIVGVDVTVPPMSKMRVHQGSAPSSCAPSSSSSTSCSSSRVPRSSAPLPISSSSPTSAHYVTLLSTVHIWPRESPRITPSRHEGPGRWIDGKREGCGKQTG